MKVRTECVNVFMFEMTTLMKFSFLSLHYLQIPEDLILMECGSMFKKNSVLYRFQAIASFLGLYDTHHYKSCYCGRLEVCCENEYKLEVPVGLCVHVFWDISKGIGSVDTEYCSYFVLLLLDTLYWLLNAHCCS